MANTICPLLSNAIPGVAVHDIKVHDAFIVKYDATHGQRFLPLHTDEGDWSLTLALNDESEYDGGGTLFDEHQLLIRPKYWRACCFQELSFARGRTTSDGYAIYNRCLPLHCTARPERRKAKCLTITSVQMGSTMPALDTVLFYYPCQVSMRAWIHLLEIYRTTY